MMNIERDKCRSVDGAVGRVMGMNGNDGGEMNDVCVCVSEMIEECWGEWN